MEFIRAISVIRGFQHSQSDPCSPCESVAAFDFPGARDNLGAWPRKSLSVRTVKRKPPSSSRTRCQHGSRNCRRCTPLPNMIGMMEAAAYNALHPFCEGDEVSVGTAINIVHRAAATIGMKIKIEAVR